MRPHTRQRETLNWVTATCPHCGKLYQHLTQYKPACCPRSACQYKHLHGKWPGQLTLPEVLDQ